jgi:hydroxymethylglutaryl-CoA reductase
MGANLINTIC